MPGFTFLNHSLETILLVGSLLLIISVLSSRISSRFGVPALLLFLVIGMLAGSEGPGNIDFENYPLSFAIGSICLAFILFDGGLQTSWKSVRPVLPLASSLSFFGTLATGAITGIFARFGLGLPWEGALLLGAIVSSTDAAAVFSILRAKNLTLKGSLKETLEFEAGSNDPVAIFLTISVLTFATMDGATYSDMGILFLKQGGLGLALGFIGGKGIRWLINNVGIEFEGLYGVLQLALVICLFSVVATIGGSGFLAVYVAGIVVGNSELLHKGTIMRFSDGIAWISQIIVFLTLGLLCTPSHLLENWQDGLILSVFMMFVARPLSVLFAAPSPKLMTKPERLFVSWVGLRGAAPIILATLPWSVNFPNAEYYFNLVFFVVLTSVIAQGISIPWVANKVKITEPIKEKTPQVEGLLPSGFVSIEVEITKDAVAADKRIVDLAMPAGVLLTSIEREGRFLVPRGDTVLAAGDKMSGLARPSNLEALIELFGDARAVT